RVDHRVSDLLLGLAVQARTLTAVARGALEGSAALLLGVDRPLDACHFLTPCFRGGYLPSSFLIFFESGADRMLSTATRRLRALVFSWNLWTFIAEACFTLPEPVSLKRFLAPECVLFLGLMAPPFAVGPPGRAHLVGARGAQRL